MFKIGPWETEQKNHKREKSNITYSKHNDRISHIRSSTNVRPILLPKIEIQSPIDLNHHEINITSQNNKLNIKMGNFQSQNKRKYENHQKESSALIFSIYKNYFPCKKICRKQGHKSHQSLIL